jgi:hypothetical protein
MTSFSTWSLLWVISISLQPLLTREQEDHQPDRVQVDHSPYWLQGARTPDPSGPVVISNASLGEMYGDSVTFNREYLFQYKYSASEVSRDLGYFCYDLLGFKEMMLSLLILEQY